MTSSRRSSDVTVTSSFALRRPINDDNVRYVTAGEDGDWSRRRTLDRPPVLPPVEGNEKREMDDDQKTTFSMTKESAEDLKTVRHWVKYSDDNAGPSVYRELADDVDEEDFDDDLHHDDDVDSNLPVISHHLDGESDRVVHVHHGHQVHDDGVSMVDLGGGLIYDGDDNDDDDNAVSSSSVTERTSSVDEQPHGSKDNDNDQQSPARTGLNYNVEEGLQFYYTCCS